MRNIMIVFVAVFVALAAVPAAAQTTGTATVNAVEKRAWNLLSGHVWRGTDGHQYLNAGCQNIDPEPWGNLTGIVRLHVKIFYRGGGGRPFFETRPFRSNGNTDTGRNCDLKKGIDIVTWRLPGVELPEGWETQADLRLHIVSGDSNARNPDHLGVANNASQRWGRLYFNGESNPYPGTGIRAGTSVVTEDELYHPEEYER